MKPTQPKNPSDQEAQFEYKCRRCGKLYINPCCNTTLARDLLTSVAYDLKNVVSARNRIHMYEVHACKDGGQGLADLQGYRVVG